MSEAVHKTNYLEEKQKRIDTINLYHKYSSGCLFDVKDIDIPPLMYLLDKIIASGQVTFMFGQTGTYKSTLSLLFALSISSGKSTTFGNVKQGNVMWIDEEMGLSGLLSKIDMTADFMQLKDDKWKKHFHYKSMTDFNIENKDTKSLMTAIINEKNIDCIFIDSLTSVTSNEDDESVRKLRNFNKIAYTTGVGIILLHHIAKANIDKPTLGIEDLKGRVDYANQVDMGFGFTKVSGHYRFNQAKGRYVKPSDKIDLNFDVIETDDGIEIMNLGSTSDFLSKGEASIEDISIDIIKWWNEKKPFCPKYKTTFIKDEMMKLHKYKKTYIEVALELLRNKGTLKHNPEYSYQELYKEELKI